MSSSGTPVPFLDLKAPHRELAPRILELWDEILQAGAFVGGQHVEGFEREFAAYVGSTHCVGMANGTDALRLALLAMGIGSGDEVITVPHTFIATTEAVTQTGATPVFVDVDPETATMDPGNVERAITPRTKAILPVHLYGQCADMEPLLETARRHGLKVLEDACQAQGAGYRGRRAGSLGDAAAFSFYPGKNLGACGEAGAVTTSDAALAERMRMLRDHGQRVKYVHSVEGYNARLDSLQAAVLRLKLTYLDAWNEQRGVVASRYRQELHPLDLRLPREAPDRKHVWHLFVLRVAKRDAVRLALESSGIGCGLHYPVPLHLQDAYGAMGHARGDFPHCEDWASSGLSLPMFPGMTEDQILAVCAAVRAACEKRVLA
jgi:dTDP-4-amino-4,6-dideoxygalactose transaminase